MVKSLSGTFIAATLCFWVTALFVILYIPSFYKNNYRSLHVCIGAGVLDPSCFKKFEAETGIKVFVSYCETSEELFTKMIATKAEGYDLIAVSDYMVSTFIERNLLKPLDRRRLTFWSDLNHKFLSPYYDVHNHYCIPAEWYALALGINTRFFNGTIPEFSWSILFHKTQSVDRIGIVNDPHALYALMSGYLYGFTMKYCLLESKKIKKVRNRLRMLQHKIEAYTDYKADLLLFSENSAATMIATTSAWKYLLDKPHIKIGIPKEGTFVHVENYALGAKTIKDEAVYTLLNFLFRYDVQKENFEKAGLLSTRKDADYMFEAPYFACIMPFIHPNTQARLPFFSPVVRNSDLTHFWVSSKTKKIKIKN